MNIQDTIKELGLIDIKLPRILNQRVNTINTLNEKIEAAHKEHEANPSEDSETKLNEIKDYAKEYFDDVVGQLKAFKSKRDAKIEKEKAQNETKETQETKKDDLASVKEDTPTKTKDDDKKEEKKSSGWGMILLGGVVLAATLGAVNIMRNK